VNSSRHSEYRYGFGVGGRLGRDGSRHEGDEVCEQMEMQLSGATSAHLTTVPDHETNYVPLFLLLNLTE